MTLDTPPERDDVAVPGTPTECQHVTGTDSNRRPEEVCGAAVAAYIRWPLDDVDGYDYGAIAVCNDHVDEYGGDIARDLRELAEWPSAEQYGNWFWNKVERDELDRVPDDSVPGEVAA